MRSDESRVRSEDRPRSEHGKRSSGGIRNTVRKGCTEMRNVDEARQGAIDEVPEVEIVFCTSPATHVSDGVDFAVDRRHRGEPSTVEAVVSFAGHVEARCCWWTARRLARVVVAVVGAVGPLACC